MTTQLKSISGHQTSKVTALLLAAVSLIMWPFMLLSTIPLLLTKGLSGAALMPVAMMVFFPLLYFAMGYLMTRLMCWVYNLIAKKFGGIEFDIVDLTGKKSPPVESDNSEN
jgi:uncharacterized membrane protein YGL010W